MTRRRPQAIPLYDPDTGPIDWPSLPDFLGVVLTAGGIWVLGWEFWRFIERLA